MLSIFDLSYEQLERYLINNNEKKYNANQIFDWLYKKRVTTFDEMLNINKETRQLLKDNFNIDELKIITRQNDQDVQKYLFELSDGNKIESVLMNHNYGNSLCISSQVGCNMGCTFCASGSLKKVRNLTASEMVLQVLMIEKETKTRISHIVIMGIGEPFDNYDNVLTFIKIINDDKGIAIGARHITVSTCGIIPKIEYFTNEDLQVNLAISLHAPNDEIRSKLMPINKLYKIDDLLLSIKKYIDKTNRRVTFEYILLDNINDREKDALELAQKLRNINCYVNLIPYNETSNNDYKKTKNDKIMHFYDILKRNNINVTVRREFGSKVDAACGQLRANNINTEDLD